MYESRRILKQVLNFLRLFCVAYDCRKQVVGLSTRHDSCRRDGVSKLHTTIVSKNRIVWMGLYKPRSNENESWSELQHSFVFDWQLSSFDLHIQSTRISLRATLFSFDLNSHQLSEESLTRAFMLRYLDSQRNGLILQQSVVSSNHITWWFQFP